MKIFGSKEEKGEDLSNEQGDAFMDFDVDDDQGAEDDSFAAVASARPGVVQGNKRTAFILVGLLVLLGVGYFLFADALFGGSTSPAPVVADAGGEQLSQIAEGNVSGEGDVFGDVPPQPEAVMEAQPDMYGGSDIALDAATGEPMPAADPVPTADFDMAGIDGGTMLPQDNTAMAAGDPASVGAADPFTALLSETQMPDAAGPDEQAEVAPVTMPDTAMQDMAVPDAAMPVPDTTAAAPFVPVENADLPMPEGVMDVMGSSSNNPTEAEQAIVDTAPVMDSVAPASTPRGSQITPGMLDDVAAQMNAGAPVRPLPSHYLVVKKEKDAEHVDARLKVARSMMSQKKYAAALEMFNTMLTDYPKDARLQMGRAVALQNIGHRNEAVTSYEQVLESDPRNLEALVNLLGLLRSEMPELAEEKLLQLRQTYPYDADILAQLAITKGQLKQYDDALMYIEMAESLQPSNLMLTYNKAILNDRMGRKDEAAQLYRYLLQRASDPAIVHSLPLDTIKKRLAHMR